MKIKCGFLAATATSQPCELTMRPVESDIGIVEALSAIAPHKTAFWQTRMTKSVVVETRTAKPFGLSRTQVEEQILKVSLPLAAEAVAQQFGVDVCLDTEGGEPADCPVDLESFCGLYSIATLGAFPDAVLVACFLSPAAVYVSRVPRGMPLGEALQNIPAIAGRLDKGEQPAHLLTGTPLPPEIPCSHLTSLIHFPQDGYALKSDDSWLFPFPAFNRNLSMKKDTPCKPVPVPCSNCMACQRFCPAGIQPSFLFHHLQADDEEAVNALSPELCIQCGWCSQICPSGLPLAQTIIKHREGGAA